jgi:hypothetical protein
MGWSGEWVSKASRETMNIAREGILGTSAIRPIYKVAKSLSWVQRRMPGCSNDIPSFANMSDVIRRNGDIRWGNNSCCMASSNPVPVCEQRVCRKN